MTKLLSQHAMNAARRIVPQSFTVSADADPAWLIEQHHIQVASTQRAAEIIQEAIDAALEENDHV